MENISLPPFYPNQKVVALTDMTTPYKKEIKKGDILTVAVCVKNNCKCKHDKWEAYLKEHPFTGKYICGDCKSKLKEDTPRFCMVEAKYLAPLEEKFEHISLSKVIELENTLVSAN